MPHLASSSFALKARGLTRSAMLFLLCAAPLVTCGGTTVAASADCQTVCEQANACLGRVRDCAGECGVRASLDMVAGCADVDSGELAGTGVAFTGVPLIPVACSDLCPSCSAQAPAWTTCVKAYCDTRPWTQVCQLSGL